jgi:hypothetical protein
MESPRLTMRGRVLGVVVALTTMALFGFEGIIGALVDVPVYLQIARYYFILFDPFSPLVRNTENGSAKGQSYYRNEADRETGYLPPMDAQVTVSTPGTNK